MIAANATLLRAGLPDWFSMIWCRNGNNVHGYYEGIFMAQDAYRNAQEDAGSANPPCDSKASAHSGENTRYGDFALRTHGREANTEPRKSQNA